MIIIKPKNMINFKKRKVVFVVGLLTICCNLAAQITIRNENVLGIGRIVVSEDISPHYLIKPGPSGSNQIWNFSLLSEDNAYMYNFIPSENTDCINSFPNSNITCHVDNNTNSAIYYLKNDDSLSHIGLCFNGVPMDYKYKLLDFPINYLDTFYQSYGGTTTRTIVDAWGTIITPNGVYEVLRTVAFYNSDTTIVSYSWFTNQPEIKYSIADMTYFSNKDSVGEVQFFKSAFQAYPNYYICVVTVDTSTWKNKILWEYPLQNNILSFNIYKETASHEWSLLGNVDVNQPGVFIDYSSNPEVHGDKYKIEAVYYQNVESIVKSPYHKTINLVISAFGSTMGLSWTPYEDEIGLFLPSKYYIYRGTTPNSMQILDSISSSFTSYNDNNVFGQYYYMVSVRKPGGCNVTGSNSESFSNKKLNFGSGINDYQIQNLSIYPNPANDKLNIDIEEKATLEIINAQGQIIETKSLTEKSNNLDLSNLVSGVYTLRIKTDRGIAIRKLIKQ